MIESDYKVFGEYKRINDKTFKEKHGKLYTDLEMFDYIVETYYEDDVYTLDIYISDGNFVFCKIDRSDNLNIANGTLYNHICKSKKILLKQRYNIHIKSNELIWVMLTNESFGSKEDLIKKIKANVGKQLNYARILEIYNGFLYNEYDLNKFICPNNNIESPRLATTEIFGMDINARYMASLCYKGKEFDDVQILCDDYWHIVGVYDFYGGYTFFK